MHPVPDCSSSALYEPSGTKAEIFKKLEEDYKHEQQSHQDQRVWKLERHLDYVTDVLCRKIDSLEAQVAEMQEPKTGGHVKV